MARKKVNYAGRFGCRYGSRVRAKVNIVEADQRKLQKCPFCESLKAKRVSTGIYECKKCNAKFANKAYGVQ
ncbi:50S ribosomal protein L37ae [Candidatus Woesearchaeota archaeon]|nr:50S ribosomal protein L37ae [Candidatus Woesearchaeota archaeon]